MLFFLDHNINGKRFYVKTQKDEYNLKRLKRLGNRESVSF